VGDDPTEWFNCVHKFFEYQGTAEAQKVSMVAYQKRRLTNGGNRFIGCLRMEDTCFHWRNSRKNFDLASDPRSVRTSTKLFPVSNS